MQKYRIKKWGRRILTGLLLAIVLSMTIPAIVGDFTGNQKTTVQAATTLPACEEGTKEPQCQLTGNKTVCPTGYTKEGTDTCKKQTTTEATNESVVRTAAFLIQLQKIINKLLWPILMMIGGLMDNSLLFGNGMEERLREIWIPIRNIVNILFVIALIGIALYNVLGIGDENSNYSIKAVLPKIIVGIIVVNFSFFGIKVFLDGINVLTTAIFALPNQVGAETVLDQENEKDKNSIDKTCRLTEGLGPSEKINAEELEKKQELKILKTIVGSNEFKGLLPTIPSNATAQEITEIVTDKLNDADLETFNRRYLENKEKILCATYTDTDNTIKMKLTPQGELFFKKWNNRSAPLAMAIGLGKIIFYEEMDIKDVASIEKIFINTALSLLLYILFAASFIALFVVLLGRLVVMWLAIALSPVLLLAMAIPVIKEKISGFGEVTNTFVQNAIAPLGIALSLSIGWIMLRALQGLNSLYGGEQISFSASEGIPVVGLTTLQDLLVGVGTLAVIWLGVFTAASKSIAAPVTDAIKGGLSRAGSWIGTLPLKHAPIFHIDLPGVEGPERYTGSQVWEAVRGLTAEKEPGKLRDLLTRRKTYYPKDIADKNKTKTPEDVLRWLKNADEQNMSAKDVQSGMLTLQKNRRPLYNKIKSEYKDLGNKIDDVINKKGNDLETAKNALLKHYRVTGYRTAAAAAAKPTAPKFTNVTNATTINNVKLTDDQVKNINPALSNLSKELGKTTLTKQTRTAADNYLKTIRDNLPAGVSAKDAKEKILGTSMVNNLKRIYTDAELDKALTG